MADSTSSLVDQYGRPIQREILTKEIAAPSTTGIRSPITGYPGDGLNPVRLANILRGADHGDPLRYFELAETIEERDLHYVGVLGKRKRQVAQLDITVEAADESAEAKKHAEFIEGILKRETIQAELFDILDAIGKGVSFVEIVWDTSEGDWSVAQLAWRDPRWFRFDRKDGSTPLIIGGYDADGVGRVTGSLGEAVLPPFKFINTVIRAKSGLPVRSGIARIALWAWMFKAFTQRDWAIFTQTFGQPVRVGKYPAGSSQGDKDTLFNAVANIAGDCAAIIPEMMNIDFIESKNVGTGSDLYIKRSNWLDQQISKAVLGQTATTDAIAGGHAVGKEHREVEEDIERADAKAIDAILNRDLVRPAVQLQFGPQKKYPKVKIGRAEDTNVELIVNSVDKLVPMGLQVERTFFNALLGIPVPPPNAQLLTAPASGGGLVGPRGNLDGNFSPSDHLPTDRTALNAVLRFRETHDPIAMLADQAEQLCGPGMDSLIGEVRAIVERSASLQQVEAELKRVKPGIADRNLGTLMQMARILANLTGRAQIPDA